MKMKKLLLLTLPLLVTACNPGGDSGFGASVVNVTASPDQIVTVNSTNTDGTTSYTFTNRAGSSATTINSATLSWKDTTGATRTETVAIPGFTLPAGFTCAAAGADPYAQCNYNEAGTTAGDRSVTRSINDAELFAKVFAANQSVTALPVTVQFNNTANALNFTFTSASPDGPVVQNPSPTLLINNTGAQPYSNILSVTASAGVAAGVGVNQLILEVTDSKGIVDTTSYTSKSETATFNIDTAKYPDGNLNLRVVAIDANDRRGISAVSTVTIANAVAPTITVVAPASGAEVTGPTPITVQVRQNNTGFSFKDNLVLIEVVDSRGQVITTQTAPLSLVNTNLWQATTSIDFNATQYLNADYTIRASTALTMSGETAVRTITAVSTITNRSKPVEPPALNILSPSFYNPNDLNNPDPAYRPILTRKSAVAVQVSDSDVIKQVSLEFVCDPAEVKQIIGQQCNVAAYNFNLPIGQAGLFYKVFNTGVLIDGQPFIPNGYYIMRVTAVDEAGHSNIKEMKVDVDRSRSGIANLTYNRVDIYDDGISKLRPTAAEWSISNLFFDTLNWDNEPYNTTVNNTRVLTFVYDSNDKGIARETPSRIGIDTDLPGNNIITNWFAFGKAGTYATSFLIQDMKTGVTEWFNGADVVVEQRE